MPATPRILLLFMIVMISAHGILAQKVTVTTSSAKQVTTTTITEPGIYKLAGLFKAAHTVAVVKIMSGDTEHYDCAVYKAQVVKSFKGAAEGETVYFGPYVGNRLGWEYIEFLRNVSKPMVPKSTSSPGYGTIRYAEEFNEGYSSMETSYECVFDGKEIAQQCDYGVRVCTDYILLPKSTPTFPPITEDTPFGCRWVRKTVFISLPEKLGGARK
jgi:hypothetical protein